MLPIALARVFSIIIIVEGLGPERSWPLAMELNSRRGNVTAA